MMKWLRRSLAGLALLVLVAAGGGYLWLRDGLPAGEGTTTVAGLDGPVQIVRDVHGVPRIRAASERDAHFGLGFVHAEDRLWQMDFHRRLGAGRLSEVLGARGLGIDRIMRTLGIRRLAERELTLLSPAARAVVESYGAGVNAYLASHRGAWPPEFYLLRYRPEAWRPADSLIWGRMMAMRLGRNWHSEALRARLAMHLSPQRLAELWPDDAGAPTVISSALDGVDGGALGRLAAAALGAMADALGPVQASDSWVVAGRHSTTGKPLLAGDPHLGYSAPNLWYLARMDAPGMIRAGATVPGVPFLILGHNRRIAWSFTNAPSDTQDLFVERIDPGDPDRYLAPGGARAFAVRDETIRVRGQSGVVLRVRRTRHGPVISDVRPDLLASAPAGHVLALAATALGEDVRTAEALYRMGGATDWASFIEAMRDFHAPHQGITYADVDGHIGFIAPGRIPLRRAGDGRAPAPGWDGSHDWTGFIPFDDLPRALDPPAGRIASANQRIVPDGYRWPLPGSWAPPYRARRIHQRLDGDGRKTPAAMAAMQRDPVSLMARDLLPLMLAVRPESARARRAVALLRSWDGTMDRNRAEPLLFMAWLRELNRAVYADELGADFRYYWDVRPLFIRSVLSGKPHWCDDVATPAREDCAMQLARALDTALDWIVRRYGADMDRWRWGEPHKALFRHPVLRNVAVLRDLTTIAIGVDGGASTLNRARSDISDEDHPFAAVHGGGFRAVYDLADLDASRFIQATGQSGNFLSPHYRDFVETWRDGGYLRLAR